MGKTHLAGSTLAMLGAYYFGKKYGFLVADVAPILQLAVMLPMSSVGGILSDMDQGSIDSAPSKTPVAKLFHAFLHCNLFGIKCKHRSWQTHSIEFTGVLAVLSFVLTIWLGKLYLSTTEFSILYLLVGGISVGVLSHLFLDMLTTEGIKCFGKRVALVPRSKMFSVSSRWEPFICGLLYVSIIVFSIEVFFGYANIGQKAIELITLIKSYF